MTECPPCPSKRERKSCALVPAEFDINGNGISALIADATARGITVIEPAGNGGQNLGDTSVYGTMFDRSSDSSAIMVGNGSDAFNGKRDSQSNYGQRVDVQANGQSVVTSGGDREGYGDLFPKSKKLSSNPAYTNVLFTGHFGGTSGAGAIVAGVAASLQSIWLERGNLPLLPACIRKILVETGTPQDKNGDQTQHIGPRPNLRAAINQGLMNE